MSSVPCPDTTAGSLPPNHFAILFEGAWIFTPDQDSGGIKATCPIPDDGMHEYQFGQWLEEDLQPLPPFELRMPQKSRFEVSIQDTIKNPAEKFAKLFDAAADKYPFVYLPGKDSVALKNRDPQAKPFTVFQISKEVVENSRTVVIPLPTSVRAAGALLTAEVGGHGKIELFSGPFGVTRSFVTFLFIYEYDGRGVLTATVCETFDHGKIEGTITASQENPTPHLIYRVRPNTEVISVRSSSPRQMQTGLSDQSAQKLHVATVFDTLRRAMPSLTGAPISQDGVCCDIAIYHDQNDMFLDGGDTGLTRGELGLPCVKEAPKGVKLPACAGGGTVNGH